VLSAAQASQRLAIQPRCGVGGHDAMRQLLRDLEAYGQPDILSITIDSHTRLRRYDHALRVLNHDPSDLNGYPLVTHGWQRGRELNEAIGVPLEVRHGSPDPRDLFEISLASGITSFEGGGISYNLPYSKNVPLAESLSAWAEVDRSCGELAEWGVIIDRELFGTLSAVLMPPSISLAISVIEGLLAAREGVRCISIAYPQGGNLSQDIAALQAIPLLARKYLPGSVTVHAVLHEFMGVFPKIRSNADDLILYGAITARLGGAAKLITKTYQEAYGIPDSSANIEGLRLARRANSPLLGFIKPDPPDVTRELQWILAEVAELVDPVIEQKNIARAVVESFDAGTLDIPFSASRHAKSKVIPMRDKSGAIRYLSPGDLAFSEKTVQRNATALAERTKQDSSPESLMAEINEDINYFLKILGESAGD
jgi:methylaspartate mutase epsilon subunit